MKDFTMFFNIDFVHTTLQYSKVNDLFLSSYPIVTPILSPIHVRVRRKARFHVSSKTSNS